MTKLLVIAAGGTGGHMFPAQALAEEMLQRGWRVKLSTDPRGARYAGGFPSEVEITEVSSGTFSRGGLVAKITVPFSILGGILTARKMMKKDRPDLVAGFGGYPALPAMGAAILLRVPKLIHEQNGVLGRVNKLFAKYVDAIACGTWPTKLPSGVEGLPVGNPVRDTIKVKAGAPYELPNSGTLSVLVMGGSQGARILSQQVPAALALLPSAMRSRLHVSQQARAEDSDDCKAIYTNAGIKAVISPFFSDVPDRLQNCQLVVSRSGASSVADISVIGRPSILIPLAIATDDHQTANAKGLSAAGAAIVIQEKDLTPEKLAEHVKTILSDGESADFMAKAALSQGKPNAAHDLADLVEKIAG